MSCESVKHLVFREEPTEVRRFPMYRSKFAQQVREEMRRVKDCHKTFGLPKEMITPKPLKKGTRKVIRPDVGKWEPGVSRMTPVPRREDWALPLHKERPYFPLRNALGAVRSAPPQGPSRVFDTAVGRRVHNCNLLQPNFVFRKDFGKVPQYLKKAKKEAEEERERREEGRKRLECEAELVREVEEVDPEERDRLIKGLKSAWEEQTRQYKLLPLVVDSTPMIKKKRNLELSLERIEKNIDLLERNKHIFVRQ